MPRKNQQPESFVVPLASRPGFLVRRLHQIHQALFLEECKDYNITPVQYGAMSALAVSPGLDQKALGLDVGLDRTNTADVLKRLEDRGLVRREQSTVDGRVKHAFLTPEGQRITEAMYCAMLSAQERLLAPLKESDRKTLLGLLHSLVDANNAFGRASMRAR